jgi:FkbM family methyltransferase
MKQLHRALSVLPGKVGKRSRRKLTRAKTIGAENRFVEACRTVNSRLLAIDLGANRGKYTKILADRFDRVIAFEPNPDVFVFLESGLSRYDNVELHQKAVETEDGVVKMFLRNGYDDDPVRLADGSTLFKSKKNVDPTRFITVEQINFIRFIEDLNEDIGVIKIDIEGAEIPVLEGLLRSPALTRIEYVFVETHEFKLPALYQRTIRLRRQVEKIPKPQFDMNLG